MTLGLQSQIDILQEWCKKWRIIVNVSKTKIVHYRKSNCRETNFKFTLNGAEIEKVEGYKYLRTYLNYCLNLERIIEPQSKAGSRALGQVIRKTKLNYDLVFKSFSQVFHSTVVPVLDYAVGAWTNAGSEWRFKKIDQIEQRAMRFYCGVPRTCPISGLTGLFAWTPGIVHRDIEVIRL